MLKCSAGEASHLPAGRAELSAPIYRHFMPKRANKQWGSCVYICFSSYFLTAGADLARRGAAFYTDEGPPGELAVLRRCPLYFAALIDRRAGKVEKRRLPLKFTAVYAAWSIYFEHLQI